MMEFSFEKDEVAGAVKRARLLLLKNKVRY